MVGVVRSAVLDRLLATWEPYAVEAYGKVAAAGDKAGADFATAAHKCNPEASADVLVGRDGPTQKAWLGSLDAAAELDKLLPVLTAAAELTGAVVVPRKGTEVVLIPLTIDVTDVHRRRLWKAFTTEGLWTLECVGCLAREDPCVPGRSARRRVLDLP